MRKGLTEQELAGLDLTAEKVKHLANISFMLRADLTTDDGVLENSSPLSSNIEPARKSESPGDEPLWRRRLGSGGRASHRVPVLRHRDVIATSRDAP